MDCTSGSENKELCGKFSVQTVPTLLLFNKGEHEKYEGEKNFERSVCGSVNRKMIFFSYFARARFTT